MSQLISGRSWPPMAGRRYCPCSVRRSSTPRLLRLLRPRPWGRRGRTLLPWCPHPVGHDDVRVVHCHGGGSNKVIGASLAQCRYEVTEYAINSSSTGRSDTVTSPVCRGITLRSSDRSDEHLGLMPAPCSWVLRPEVIGVSWVAEHQLGEVFGRTAQAWVTPSGGRRS